MTRTRKLAFQSNARQSGVALFVALIFLVLLTVMALTTFTISKGTQQVIGNMTIRNQTFQAALQTSEAAISTKRLIHQPTAVLFDGSTYSNTAVVDINGDGKTQITARITPPACITAALALGSQLDLNDPAQQGCAFGTPTLSCYSLTFQFSTTATDATTGASSTVTQGAATIADPGDAHTDCQGPSGPYI